MKSMFFEFKEQIACAGTIHKDERYRKLMRTYIIPALDTCVPIYIGSIKEQYDEINKSLEFMRDNEEDFGIRFPYEECVLFWKAANGQHMALLISTEPQENDDGEKVFAMFPFYYDNYKYVEPGYRHMPACWIPYPAGITSGEKETSRKYFDLIDSNNLDEDLSNIFKHRDDNLRLWYAIGIHVACLLTCKNIRLDDRTETVVSRVKKANSNKTKAKKTEVQYKTLVIDLTPKQQREYGLPATMDFGSKGLHLCRGHYKNYKKGNGLFGRYKGIFWWPSIVKGNNKQKVIVKDYELKT